jgi:acyl transferase domain-containing protein
VDYASHSAEVARVQGDVLAALSELRWEKSRLPFYSTVSGEIADTAGLNGAYWYQNLRERVLFDPAVRRLVEDGYRVFIEMSPHPVLTAPVQEIVEDVDDAVVLSSSRRDRGEIEAVVGSLAQLYVLGGSVDWTALFGERRRVPLPTYAFRRQRYWLESEPRPVAPSTELAGSEPAATELPASEDRPVPLADILAELPESDAEKLLLEHVLEKVAVVLGRDSEETIDPDQDFRSIGFDSLLSVELSKRLASSTGLRLKASLVLKHPSPRLIAAHIMSSIADRDPG